MALAAERDVLCILNGEGCREVLKLREQGVYFVRVRREGGVHAIDPFLKEKASLSFSHESAVTSSAAISSITSPLFFICSFFSSYRLTANAAAQTASRTQSSAQSFLPYT